MTKHNIGIQMNRFCLNDNYFFTTSNYKNLKLKYVIKKNQKLDINKYYIEWYVRAIEF